MSITSRINEMSSHIEQAYDELQGLGADLTNVNKNIENISMVLDDIYDSMPQVSGEGTNLTLDDTRVGKIKSTLKGNTSQTGTPTPSSPQPVNVVSGDNEINVVGKNLLKLEDVSATTTGGITYSISNGVITLNGTASGEWGINFGTYNFPVGNYAYSDFRATTNNNLYTGLTYSNGWQYAVADHNKKTSTTTGAMTKFRIYVVSGTTLNNVQLKPMLVSGTTVPTTYEPYSGNTYSIDLPPIGKNLFDINKVVIGAYSVSNNKVEGIITGNTTRANNYNKPLIVESSTTYTISFDSTYRIGYYECDDNDNILVDSGWKTATTSFTTTPNTKKIYFNISLVANTTIDLDNLKSQMKLQIEKNSSATSYEPYQSIELCKIGNYQDYFYKDSGKWYLHKEIGKVVLDGSENWESEIAYTGYYRYIVSLLFNLTNISDGMNNRFFQRISQAHGDYEYLYIQSDNGALHIQILPSRLSGSSATDFKNWLSNNNVILYYVLATSTNTEITDTTLISQLNALEQATSKNGETNISQVNNDLPFIISASALKEWQESTSLNSTLSMVNPLSLGNTLNTQENNTQPIEADNIEPLEEEENEES